MRQPLQKFYEFLGRPLYFPARLVLVLLVIPIVLSFFEPLWNITLEAPQYPDSLTLDIYSYKLEGGNEGQHIDEINVLNHYIGMQPISREDMTDLDWIPFALGFLVILTLRVAAIGSVRSLIDLLVINLYFSLFSLARFVVKLYNYGHELNPRAPITVDPFMPAVFGSKQIANFTTLSYPRMGTVYLAIYATGLVVLVLWHLISGRRQAVRAEGVADEPASDEVAVA
jgi:hypothetical protein